MVYHHSVLLRGISGVNEVFNHKPSAERIAAAKKAHGDFDNFECEEKGMFWWHQTYLISFDTEHGKHRFYQYIWWGAPKPSGPVWDANVAPEHLRYRSNDDGVWLSDKSTIKHYTELKSGQFWWKTKSLKETDFTTA